jgi:hypothetical protein
VLSTLSRTVRCHQMAGHLTGAGMPASSGERWRGLSSSKVLPATGRRGKERMSSAMRGGGSACDRMGRKGAE